jgi:phosphate transport system substrate-binding protein
MPSSRTCVAALAALIAVGCGGNRERDPNRSMPDVDPSTGIAIDGSSTVFPIAEEALSAFTGRGSHVATSLNVSGTSGGFRRFCSGETTLNGASRPITRRELAACNANGVDFIELPIAYDGIAVVVHPSNYWVNSMSVEQLRRLWEAEAEGSVMRWNDLNPTWPDREIDLYGPGADSGTYDYFAQAIVEGGALRSDYTASEDDYYLVRRIRRDVDSLGFFGYAYYAGNRGRLKIVPISDGNEGNGPGAIAPSPETIADGTYQPLSRPLFVYLAEAQAEREEVRSFVGLILANPAELIPRAGYVTLRPRAYELVRERFEHNRLGSAFSGAHLGEGLTVEMLLEE